MQMQGGIAQVPVTCAKGCERVTGTCANTRDPLGSRVPGVSIYELLDIWIT